MTITPPSTEDTAMPKDLNDMNDESQQLVTAAREAMVGIEPQEGAPIDADLAAVAAAAVLTKLSELMRPGWENDSEWPDPDDLELIAADITGGVA